MGAPISEGGPQNVKILGPHGAPKCQKILEPQGPRILKFWGLIFTWHLSGVKKIGKNGPYACAAFMSIVEAQRATGDISKV